ncbi:MAG: hypothetical protein J6K89_06350 [Oscillospiraceae bacterium]|nr:hypothetical protein [Oscillospiraceae bacterium]
MADQRIIDANFVKSAVLEVMADNRSEELFIKVAERLCKMLDHVPTVDAVPVVRCKDCKKWEYDENFSGWCIEWRRRTLGNHFCSYGERREGDGCPPQMDWDCAKDKNGWDACDACWCKWLQQPAGEVSTDT